MTMSSLCMHFTTHIPKIVHFIKNRRFYKQFLMKILIRLEQLSSDFSRRYVYFKRKYLLKINIAGKSMQND